jgi:hypothetical protein
VSGQALLDYAATDRLIRRASTGFESRSADVPGRLQLYSAPDRRCIGFITRMSAARSRPADYPPVERTNYDYLAAVHGDFKSRFFYTLGGSLEHYSLFGTQTRRARV